MRWGTVDSWLIWTLTGGATYATEPGNASRTMLFDIDRLAWDKELCALFGLDLAPFPNAAAPMRKFRRDRAGILRRPHPDHRRHG